MKPSKKKKIMGCLLANIKFKTTRISQKKESWVGKLMAADVFYPTYKHEGCACLPCAVPACHD